MIWLGLVQMVNMYRVERGDPPDATYGPRETEASSLTET